MIAVTRLRCRATTELYAANGACTRHPRYARHGYLRPRRSSEALRGGAMQTDVYSAREER